MPYSFEATFTQPILTKLDSGTIKGAKDWANAITKGYIRTIKAGLPQGVPPTLPAPSQLGAPYPIGASAFTTADARSKIMYKVIYAYYYAKEVSLDKGAIQGLIADVRQLILKIKIRTQQVRALIQTTKLLSEQLKELPKLLTEIEQGIREEISTRVEEIKGIAFSLEEFKPQLGSAQFASVFAQELALIDKIKKFDPSNLSGLNDIFLFVSDYGKRTNNTLASTDNVSLMKRYVLDRLFGVAKVLLELAGGITNPTRILDFVNRTKQDRIKAIRLFERIKQFDLFVRFIQPRLRRLEEKKKALVKQIRDQLQKKLVDLRKRLTDKIAEFTKRKQVGKAGSLYKKATKIINDIKNKVQKQVKNNRKKIKLLQAALRSSITIGGKITTLILGLKVEFESIKNSIAEEKKQYALLLKKLSEISTPGSAPAGSNNQIDFRNLNASELKVELEKLNSYFASLGLGEFVNSAALVMIQTRCDLRTFKNFFERKRNTISQYAAEINSLQEDILKLTTTLQELKNSAKASPQPGKRTPKWLSRVQSLSDLLHLIITKVRPKIAKIRVWVRTKIRELKSYIKEHLEKFKENLRVYAINLLPLKSDVQDAKDRGAEAQSKLKTIKEKIAKIKKLILLGSFITKIVRGSLRLTANMTKGNYKFSENENSIDLILDGLYLYKGYNQSGAVAAGLVKEKMKVKTQFKSLILIENLSYGLVETFKQIKETGFEAELDNLIKDQRLSVTSVETLKAFQAFVKNPPKTPLELRQAADSLTVGILNDANVATKITDLEARFLAKSRNLIVSLCDIRKLEGTRFEKTLLKIKRTIEKKQSFILLALHLLRDELKRFASFLTKKVQQFAKNVKEQLQKTRGRVLEDSKNQLKKERDKRINVDALAMSFAFGLAARLFWTGAQWIGPTGTTHVGLSIGPFKPIKAKSTDGASKMIREIAKSFERQLQAFNGLAIPPAPTGIPPIPFVGYK